MSRRVAAIDCGTNSVRLLIAEEASGGFTEVERGLILTRLGQGVDATGQFAPEALARTLDAASEYARRIEDAGVERVRFVATSAARDASNRDEFFSGIRERLGVEAEIIPGEEEARLSFTGAVSAASHLDWPVLVMDIGGGSTELVLGDRDADGVRILSSHSMNVGSVRLRERFLHSDPIAPDEAAAASDFIDGLIDASGVDVARATTWIGVGGTATSLAAIDLGLTEYDRERVNGSSIAADRLQALSRRLLAMPVSEVLSLPTMHPKRADVIGGGSLIAARVGVRTGLDLSVSESDILDGLVLDMLA